MNYTFVCELHGRAAPRAHASYPGMGVNQQPLVGYHPPPRRPTPQTFYLIFDYLTIWIRNSKEYYLNYLYLTNSKLDCSETRKLIN